MTRMYLNGRNIPHDIPPSKYRCLLHWEMTGELRGPKVKRFSDVLKGGDELVLDTWMLRGLNSGNRWSARIQRHAENRVRRIAQEEGLKVHQVQAGIWAGILKHHGRRVPSGHDHR